MGKTFIIVPAYNEAKHIATVIHDLQNHGYNNIIVIDDGSKDDTATVAKTCGATVLSHGINRGQGAALYTGIKYALLCNADIIITFDSDGQHLASEIPKLIKPIKQGIADIVLGSRFLRNTSHTPFMRKILLTGSRIIIFLFYGLWMTDAHNGFRALTRKAAQLIEIRSNRMEHASEIIGEIKQKKLRYLEFPTIIRYTDETIKKGAGGFIGAIRILIKMIIQKITR
ncbi:MAG: glycosyltransferase family 2 protein [Nanoarchaeota archaeon]